MKKVRVVHSWWSLPMRNGRWNVEDQIKNSLYINALSVYYAKTNGCEIVCHCDSFMKPYLEDMGYDELICDLDGIENDTQCDCVFMWAAGKFYAMKNEPLGAIHIDFDVFLTKPDVVNLLKFNEDEDILFSHIETSNEYKERELLKELIPTCDMSLTTAANVGIIGFNNQEAKDDYFNHYFHYFKTLQYDTNGDKDLNADLILEQIYLMQLLSKYKSRNLIGDQSKDSAFTMQSTAIMIGFEHLMGRAKYSHYVMKLVKQKLNKFNKELFNKIDNLIIEI